MARIIRHQNKAVCALCPRHLAKTLTRIHRTNIRMRSMPKVDAENCPLNQIVTETLGIFMMRDLHGITIQGGWSGGAASGECLITCARTRRRQRPLNTVPCIIRRVAKACYTRRQQTRRVFAETFDASDLFAEVQPPLPRESLATCQNDQTRKHRPGS